MTGVHEKERHFLPGRQSRPHVVKFFRGVARDERDGVFGHLLRGCKFRRAEGFGDRRKRHGVRRRHQVGNDLRFVGSGGDVLSHGGFRVRVRA